MLLAQGKPRTLGGRARPWRVRLYATEDGGTKYAGDVPRAGWRRRAG